MIRIRELKNKYERYITPAALLLGFIFDSLTLRGVDFLIENLILLGYLVIASLGIVIANLSEERSWNILSGRLYTWSIFVIQFAFGGLFSAFTVFYFRSSSITASWIFVLILFLLMVGSEVFKRHYAQVAFQTTILFFAIFVFSIFIIPILLGKIGAGIFVVSGVVAVIIFISFLYALSRITPVRFREGARNTIIASLCVLAFINTFYFLNIIPPIPLSLKNMSVYHNVVHLSSGEYRAEKEVIKGLFADKKEIHVFPDEEVFVFSSIFAPTRLSTDVVYHWQYLDENTDEWVTVSTVNLEISGGRDEGYRSYSSKSNLKEGKWRVTVETLRGQQIGSIKFKIARPTEERTFETVTL